METGVAPHYVQHLGLGASSNAVGCETHIEHVSYAQKRSIYCPPVGWSSHADLISVTQLTDIMKMIN